VSRSNHSAGPPYPKLLKGYLDFFDCGNNKKSISREIAKWNAKEFEDALAVAGLPCCRAFSREDWLSQPQGSLLGQVPVIQIEKIADGPPVPFSGTSSPLANIRVPDFTGAGRTEEHSLLASPLRFSNLKLPVATFIEPDGASAAQWKNRG
jgi:hypothetical protein